MKGGILLQLGSLFGGLSLISVGGANVLVPEIRRHVVGSLAWMDEASFTRLFAIAQAAPGPNVMFASIIGWKVAGLAGLLVATVAILTPSSLLALVSGRGIRRNRETRAVRLLTATLTPIALGLMAASGVVAARAVHGGSVGYAITAGASAIVVLTNRNPLLAMAAGTLIYMIAAGG
jgi:chromate transporter